MTNIQKLFLLFLNIISILLVSNISHSANFRIVTNEGIDTWLISAVPQTGDAVAKGYPTDWIKENGGIGEIALSDPKNGPKAGDKIVADPKFAWKEVKGLGGDNIIDFQRADIGWGDIDYITAYMYLYITADRERTVNILVGSDDTIKVWLNGENIHSNPALRGVAPNQDLIKDVKLKQGINGLLIKICEHGGGWAGWCRIEPVEGLRISTDKDQPGKPIPAPKSANFYITGFLSLIGPNPQPSAAISACNEDLIKKWTNSKFTEDDISLGRGIDKNFPLAEKNADGWKLTEFTNFGGDNIQILVKDFFGRVADQNDITWYGYTAIISPDRRNVTLRAGSDDAIKIWLNGKVVHNNPILRGASGFLDSVDITLERGINSLLVKVCEQGGGWSSFVGFDNQNAYNGIDIDPTKVGKGFAVNPKGKIPSKWGNVKEKLINQ